MPQLYVSQGVIDRWMSEQRVQLEGERLTMSAPAGADWTFGLCPALYFEQLDGPGDDAHQLVGTVRSVEALAELGGEHAENAAVVGPDTYAVRPGFVATPLAANGAAAAPDSPTWAAIVAALAD